MWCICFNIHSRFFTLCSSIQKMNKYVKLRQLREQQTRIRKDITLLANEREKQTSKIVKRKKELLRNI